MHTPIRFAASREIPLYTETLMIRPFEREKLVDLSRALCEERLGYRIRKYRLNPTDFLRRIKGRLN